MEKMRWSRKSGILILVAALIWFVGAAPAGAQNLPLDNNQGPSCVYRAGAHTLTASAVTDAVQPDTPQDASGHPEPLGNGWTQTQIIGGFMLPGIAFGNGRNDDVVRLYATQYIAPFTNNTVKEFTYDGTWSNTSNIGLPFYSEKSLELGDGRNDGVVRVYTGEFWGGGNAREFTWEGDTWSATVMPATGQQLVSISLGPGRGDDANRVYFSTGSTPPLISTREFSYSEAVWTESAVTSPAAGGSFGLAIGDGQNNGVNRVYVGTTYPASTLNELTWNGTGWDAVQIDAISSQIMSVAVGDGRNDGINRVYVVARFFGVYEYTFADDSWSLTGSIPIPVPPLTGVYDLAIGPGRNDETNRLYIVQLNPATIHEASFDGDAWTVSTVGTLGGNLFRVRVGDARGDGLNRLYAAGTTGLFEYEWQ